MKTTFTCTMLLLAGIHLAAQDAIDRYFDQLQEDPNVTSITISSKMFQLFAKLDSESEEGKSAMEAMRGLKGIRILSKENGDAELNKSFHKALNSLGKEYETLMSVDDKEEKVRFFIREKEDVVEELLMLVGGSNTFFVMSISGNIDLAKISSLSKSMNVGGMNYLEGLEDAKGAKGTKAK